ncbi:MULTISPECIES: cytochrome c-type biogenesis protein [Spongiibacter]|uniref:cytochrome c-type biogenesis protein n=1 Tax=Spongiibacter TaxID=630749 RepID=UPI000C6A7F4C|nr:MULTISPECIES: cytochrome c-type biogenesis protein [Spongiibacter]MAY37592.1 cytochrome c-type biogenesis protein CcmH [Spongiibacter sp.]MBO6751578.1 cytochrome c-type biogenesis protein CcmH [Spongiibacter sp.]MBU70698.1 cytochrome c-type biogenesis protein CcmH [Spongiibacter sp.]|tara:strand:+ start:24246 stop:24737 length:492 start_codon:yes stop_codon:yes gene_type:complete
MLRRLSLLMLLVLALPAMAVIETYQFDTELQRQRYNAFIEELRCPKCQNQNLSGSDSAIAQDLRRQIHQMIMAGKSDIEITQYMVDRYGDFVLYRPRFNAATAVLWLGPVVLLVLGLGIWAMLSRRRKSAVPENGDGDVLSEQDRLRLQRLLSEEDTSRGGDQ